MFGLVSEIISQINVNNLARPFLIRWKDEKNLTDHILTTDRNRIDWL